MNIESQRIGGASMTCHCVWVLIKLALYMLEVCNLFKLVDLFIGLKLRFKYIISWS